MTLASCVRGEKNVSPDKGYRGLFVTSNASLPRTCEESVRLERLAEGTFLLPSSGQMEMGNERFTTVLDTFGRLTKVEFEGDRVCFSSKMLDTNFYNASLRLNHIAPAVLFTETDPPRKCDVAMCNQVAMMTGKSDNTWVNTVRVNRSTYLVTDTHTWIELDSASLGVKGPIQWNKRENPDLHITELGSAHPLKIPTHSSLSSTNNTDEHVALRSSFGMMYGEHAMIDLYRVSSDVPPVEQPRLGRIDTANLIKAASLSFRGEFVPYIHSFGMTAEGLAIIPIQPVHMNFMKLIEGGSMLSAIFEDVQEMNSSMFALVQMSEDDSDDRNVQFVHAKSRFWFVHVVNAFQVDNETSIIDLTVSTNENPLNSPAVNIAVNLNKTLRDEKLHTFKMHVRRFEVNRTSGNVVETEISDLATSTDFPRINPMYSGRPYCYYYACEWFHADNQTYGSMAIVKQKVPCNDGDDDVTSRGPSSRQYWARDGYFPSEPQFVPRRTSSDDVDVDEDDGYIIFVALNGQTGRSSLVVVDARTMKETSETTIPLDGHIAFTTHGEFYPS